MWPNFSCSADMPAGTLERTNRVTSLKIEDTKARVIEEVGSLHLHQRGA